MPASVRKSSPKYLFFTDLGGRSEIKLAIGDELGLHESYASESTGKVKKSSEPSRNCKFITFLR